jgi:hypothetical protein
MHRLVWLVMEEEARENSSQGEEGRGEERRRGREDNADDLAILILQNRQNHYAYSQNQF